jgi:hypothetical protein
MTRFRLAAALAAVLAAGAMAAAQPGAKPLQFKQFGTPPEQFQQSALTRWTGELAVDLEAVKGDIARAEVGPAARTAVNAAAERALRDTADLDQQVRRGAAKDKLHAAFTEVDRSLGQLAGVISQYPAAKAATVGPMARIDTAYHQLAAALGTADDTPARRSRRLVRLGDSIDDAAEDLRNLCADQIPNDERALDRALGAYARESRAFSRRARDGADGNALNRTFAGLAARWADAVAQLGRVQQLPPAVQAQAARVDGLHRRLAQALELPPYPPGVNPPSFQPEKRLSFAVGAGATGQPRVTVYSDDRGTVAFNFFAYDVKFDGGARVDMADLNGDGVPELVVAPGPSKTFGGLPVRVYDGRDMRLLVEFVPFPNWKGGVYAAGAPLSKDRRALIAVTAEGTQHVKVFDLAQGKEVDSFFAHDQKVPGGVRVAWGDVNGDGVPDLLTVNGPSTVTTVVKVFSGKNREVLAEFPAVEPKYRGGAFIAAADLTGDGLANAVVGMDAGTVPLVRVFDAKGKSLVEWLAYDEKFRGGVRVAVTGRNHVVAGPGLGIPNSPVRVFHTGRLKNPPVEIVPFVNFNGGVYVGGK